MNIIRLIAARALYVLLAVIVPVICAVAVLWILAWLSSREYVTIESDIAALVSAVVFTIVLGVFLVLDYKIWDFRGTMDRLIAGRMKRPPRL